jgi:hypothetical protein
VGSKLLRVAVPLGCVLAFVGAAMASYNAHVTGSPWHLPYQVHEETYGVAPLFIFQQPRPVPAYRHAVLRAFHTGLALQPYKAQQSLPQTSAAMVWKCRDLWRFYLAPVFTVPLLTLPWLLRSRWVRLALATCGLVVLAVLLVTWSNPTYCSPATCLVFFLVVQGMRQLTLWRPNKRPAGKTLVAGLLLVEVSALLLAVALPGPILHRPDWARQRSAMLAQLRGAPGKHLVLVHYAADHDPVAEWVYNEADIDAAPVVWAREMDAESDRELFGYFHDRHVWLVEADVSPPRLTPLRTGTD